MATALLLSTPADSFHSDLERYGHIAKSTRRGCGKRTDGLSSDDTEIYKAAVTIYSTLLQCCATVLIQKYTSSSIRNDVGLRTFQRRIRDISSEDQEDDTGEESAFSGPLLARSQVDCAEQRFENKELGNKSSPLDVFDATSTFRQHGKKAAKAAAREAQKNKWADSDDDNDGSPGKEGNGDKNNGSSGNGAGDDGERGRGRPSDANGDKGDEEEDEWNMAGNKKNKKKKKAAFSWDALEDEGDDKGGEGQPFGTTEADVKTTDADANKDQGDDDWNTFETSASKKKKKLKSKENTEVDDVITKDAPQIEPLDIEGDTKAKTTGFGFGAITSGWGTGKASSWGFGNIGVVVQTRKRTRMPPLTLAFPLVTRLRTKKPKIRKPMILGISWSQKMLPKSQMMTNRLTR